MTGANADNFKECLTSSFRLNKSILTDTLRQKVKEQVNQINVHMCTEIALIRNRIIHLTIAVRFSIRSKTRNVSRKKTRTIRTASNIVEQVTRLNANIRFNRCSLRTKRTNFQFLVRQGTSTVIHSFRKAINIRNSCSVITRTNRNLVRKIISSLPRTIRGPLQINNTSMRTQALTCHVRTLGGD